MQRLQSRNITLTNVVVVNNLSGTIFTAVTLLPTEVTNFNGAYLAPTNCSTTSTSTAASQVLRFAQNDGKGGAPGECNLFPKDPRRMQRLSRLTLQRRKGAAANQLACL